MTKTERVMRLVKQWKDEEFEMIVRLTARSRPDLPIDGIREALLLEKEQAKYLHEIRPDRSPIIV